jgi:hypothetical protein
VFKLVAEATKPFWQELAEATAKKFCENFAQECGKAVGKKGQRTVEQR